MTYDVVVIGAGISGTTLAERFASQLGAAPARLDRNIPICYALFGVQSAWRWVMQRASMVVMFIFIMFSLFVTAWLAWNHVLGSSIGAGAATLGLVVSFGAAAFNRGREIGVGK